MCCEKFHVFLFLLLLIIIVKFPCFTVQFLSFLFVKSGWCIRKVKMESFGDPERINLLSIVFNGKK